MRKTVCELFAGVGGFRIGLNHIDSFDAETGKAIDKGNWDFVWANQWEPATKIQHAFDCYQKRFGYSDSHSNEDITAVDKSSIPDHTLLVGGFPCQDYSVARTLSGEMGIQGKKGVLFWDIADILKAKNPPFVLLENVDRLLKAPAKQRGRDFGIMLRTFYDNGYDLEWRVINAAEYGFAQKRRRTFIFAWKRDTRYGKAMGELPESDVLLHDGMFAHAFPGEPSIKTKNHNLLVYEDTVEMTEKFSAEFLNSGVMLRGSVTTGTAVPVDTYKPIPLRETREDTTGLDEYFLTESQLEKFKYLKGSKRIPRKRPNGEIYYYSEGGMSFPDDLDQPGRTMLTSESTINRSTHVIEDKETGKIRFITPIEAERLQGFPDNWTDTGMPKSKRYFMMGNALVTGVIGKMEPYLAKIINREPEDTND